MTERHAQTYFLLTALAGSLVLTYYIFAPFLGALVLAAIFAVLLKPIYRKMLRTMPQWPLLATTLTVLGTVLVFLLPISFLASQAVIQAQEVYVSLVEGRGLSLVDALVPKIEGVLQRYVSGIQLAEISGNLAGYARAGLEWIIAHLGAIFSSFASFLVSLFVFFIALFYFLRDGERLKSSFIAISPFADANDEKILQNLELAINSVVRGNLAIAILQGISTGVGFWLFGIPNAILWSSIAAVAALVPNIGTGAVLVPGILYLFFLGDTSAAVGLMIWGVTAVGLIDNLLGPRLISGAMNIHPLFILLAVLGGLSLFGPVGIFLGPITLSLLSVFLSLFSELSRRGEL